MSRIDDSGEGDHCWSFDSKNNEGKKVASILTIDYRDINTSQDIQTNVSMYKVANRKTNLDGIPCQGLEQL